MAKKKSSKKTIQGTVFVCSDCGKRFVAGSAGYDPLYDRVHGHYKETGHYRIPAINPKPGMLYKTVYGTILEDKPFKKGLDPDKWYNEIIGAGGAIPVWELKK